MSSSIFGKIVDTLSSAFDINSSTLSGAIDIVVVQNDGSFISTPFHVRFGKLHLWNSREKIVKISVNNNPIDFVMKLGKAGEAFFVEEVFEDENDENIYDSDWSTSPINSPRSEYSDSNTKVEDLDLNQSPLPKDNNDNENNYTWLWGSIPKKSKIEDDENENSENKAFSILDTISTQNQISNKNLKSNTNKFIPIEKNETFCKESNNFTDIPFKVIDSIENIKISKCGPLSNLKSLSKSSFLSNFNKNLINFDEFLSLYYSFINFSENSDITNIFNEIIVNHHNYYYSFDISIIMISSLIFYKKSFIPDYSIGINWIQDNEPSAITNSITPKKRYRKLLLPPSEVFNAMNLKKGKNSISFSVISKIQGLIELHASIYLWPQNAKIVVSDIDGTITKSDFFGNFLPLMGKDWSHTGVASFFSNINQNGYYMLYLSSRAIGQVEATRGYLNGISQDRITLPDGPVFLSPESLMYSFKREVIDRRPQDFKILALEGIKSLFPEDFSPFFAGFGNRDSDHVSYSAVGIPSQRIYIINSAGEIYNVLNANYRKSYSLLNETVDCLFPPITNNISNRNGIEENNNFHYWRHDYSYIDIEKILEDTLS